MPCQPVVCVEYINQRILVDDQKYGIMVILNTGNTSSIVLVVGKGTNHSVQ